MRTAEEILESIVADVEAMQTDSAPYEMDRIGNPEEEDYWFGWFENGWRDSESYMGYAIQWPNLGILLKEAKEYLDQKKETTT